METLPSTNIQFAQEAYNKARINYDNLSNKFTKVSGGTAEDLKNLKIAEDQMKQADSIIQDYKMKYATSFPTTIKDAPIGDFSQGPRTISTGKVPNYGISDQPTKGTLVGDQFFPDTLTTPDLKGVKEVGKDLITTKLKTNVTELVETGKKSLKIVPITARIMGGALDALFGVTDEDRMRQTENKNALTSLGYKTVGGNVDAGRIAGNPADNVFAGKNMVSAKGDIMQGARNRVSTRNSSKTQARISKLSPERQKAFNDKTEEFQKQINAAQDKKNKQALAKGGVAPGASGGSGDGGGCFLKGTQVTMLNGSTKVIEQVDLGDNVAKGGKVFAVGRFLINNLYDYKGIKVSGSHMVNEDDKWIRIEDSKHGKALGNDEHTVYVFGSENRRILINDILFTDYFEVTDQEKLLKYEDKFFDNWGIYSKNEDTNNINILNAS
jgi:hypothetical protein